MTTQSPPTSDPVDIPGALGPAGSDDAALAGLLRFSPDAIVLSDEDGRIVEFNAGAEALFGWPRADVIGRKVGAVIVPPSLRDRHETGMARLRAGEARRIVGSRVEMPALRRSGEEFPCEMVLSEIRLDETRLFAAIMRDVTELRSALEEQRQATEFLRSIFDDQTEVIFLFDADLRLSFANLAALRFYDKPLAEMKGQHLFADVDPSVRPRLEAELQALTPEEPTTRSTDPKGFGAGERRWLDWTNRMLFDDSGKRRGILSVGRDVTARVEAQAALQASEERFATFMRHAPVGMYLKEKSGHYLLANPEMAHVFGRPVEEVVGKRADALFDPAHVAVIEAADAAVLQNGRPSVIEEHLPGLEKYEWTLVVRFPVPSADGNDTLIGGFDIDITPIKRAEEEVARARTALFQNEKMNALGAFAAGVVHELNNPLTVLLGQAEMLADEAEGTAFAERAQTIERVVARCGRIARSFLSVARRSAPMRHEVLDLSELVMAVLDVAAPALRNAGISVHQEHEDLPFPVTGDGDYINQVLLNLLLNAQQALSGIEGARRITVETRASTDGRHATIDVVDTGPGVPIERQAEIFEPFVTTKTDAGGTGLGLSISRQVIEAQGGTLELVPCTERNGARFRITLPFDLSDTATGPER